MKLTKTINTSLGMIHSVNPDEHSITVIKDIITGGPNAHIKAYTVHEFTNNHSELLEYFKTRWDANHIKLLKVEWNTNSYILNTSSNHTRGELPTKPKATTRLIKVALEFIISQEDFDKIEEIDRIITQKTESIQELEDEIKRLERPIIDLG